MDLNSGFLLETTNRDLRIPHDEVHLHRISFFIQEQWPLSGGRGVSLVNTGSVRYAFSTNQDSTMAFTEYGRYSFPVLIGPYFPPLYWD